MTFRAASERSNIRVGERETRQVAVIGVGLLGSVVASRLLQHGFSVRGYDTRREPLAALGPQGLEGAASIAEVCEGAEAVFTILPTPEIVEAVMRGPRGLVEVAPRETTLVQTSTISPELARRLGEAAAAAGLGFLDAPVSGTSAMVARGDSTMIVGGDGARLEACRPLFDAIAPRIIHVGAVGLASLAKLVVNLLMGLNVAAVAEALVLGIKGGLSPALLLDVLNNSAAASKMLEIRGGLMVSHRFEPQGKLDVFLKDLRLMAEEGERLRAPLPLTHLVQQLWIAAAAHGHGGDDLASVVTTFERLAGVGDTPREE